MSSNTRFGTTARQGDLLEPRNIEIVAARVAQQTAEEKAKKRAAAFDAMEAALQYVVSHATAGLGPGGNVYLQLNLVKTSAAEALALAKECK